MLVLATSSNPRASSSEGERAKVTNNWPIIGIFAQPTTSKEGNCGGNCQYIAASYVKYLESAGARVVPIDYYSTPSELDTLLSSLNGVFFTGGGSAFPAAAQYAFDKVVSFNAAGDFFPLWGTCMGFQWLLLAACKQTCSLDPPTGQMDAYNLSIPLTMTKAGFESSLFSSAPKEVVDILTTQNVTMNNHHYGMYPSHFMNTPSLANMFNLLSTNKDRNGVEFVSTIEAFKFPIYGAQWHPEKNPFEWGKDSQGIPLEAINHSPDAIKIAQYASNFFVEEARKNSHSFATFAAEDSALIYNYSPSKTTGSFMETYFFPEFKKGLN